MIKVTVNQRPSRVLFFDIENKPGTYGPGDYTHPKVTALGARFLDGDETWARCMKRRLKGTMRRDCEGFRKLWDQADWVAGHNIKRHDLKILDGFYTSLDLPLLARKQMLDTYMDMPKMAGLSRSLENLADRWGSPVPKLHLSEFDWEQAYDEVPAAVEKMRRRVTTDVEINIWLYHEQMRRNLLTPKRRVVP